MPDGLPRRLSIHNCVILLTPSVASEYRLSLAWKVTDGLPSFGQMTESRPAAVRPCSLWKTASRHAAYTSERASVGDEDEQAATTANANTPRPLCTVAR